MYLVRPRPLPGESLSSWRQAAAHANGQRLYQLHDEPRRTDPDSCPVGTLSWLASEFDVSLSDLQHLSLSCFVDRLSVRQDGKRGMWLVPLRYSGDQFVPASAFCPRCLSAHSRPAFKLAWRLAFVTVCDTHECDLVDRCPACGSQAWPSVAPRAKLFARTLIALDECAICGFRLSGALSRPRNPSTTAQFLKILAGNRKSIEGHELTAGEYFDGVRAVCQLFLRRRSGAQIARRNSILAADLGFVPGRIEARQVELLDLNRRRALLDVALQIVDPWPESFVDFCHAAKLTQQHFSGAEALAPNWMRGVIDRQLRLQNRGVSSAKVDQVIDEMRCAGIPITKHAVAKRLLCNGAIAVERALGRRFVATNDELELLVERLACPRSDDARALSTYTTTRDAVVLLSSIVLQASVQDVSAMCLRDLEAAVTDHPASKSSRLHAATAALSLIAQLLRHPRHCQETDPAASRLQGARGAWGSKRSTQREFARAMRGMDPRLLRSIRVFQSTPLESNEEPS